MQKFGLLSKLQLCLKGHNGFEEPPPGFNLTHCRAKYEVKKPRPPSHRQGLF